MKWKSHVYATKIEEKRANITEKKVSSYVYFISNLSHCHNNFHEERFHVEFNATFWSMHNSQQMLLILLVYCIGKASSRVNAYRWGTLTLWRDGDRVDIMTEVFSNCCISLRGRKILTCFWSCLDLRRQIKNVKKITLCKFKVNFYY